MDNQGRTHWLATPCPAWCQRDHAPDDHIDDRRHQGSGLSIPLTLSTETPPRASAHALDVVVYADQSATTADAWIRVESTESGLLRFAVTPESAHALAKALISSIADLD